MKLDKAIIEKIICISKEVEGINKIVLFGSRARGDNELKSDIDIAIYADNNGAAVDFIERTENEVPTLLEFDFSDMRKVKDALFLKQVERDGIILYEKH
ncbi:MAG: nucleotidyltransferase domain-containing protein [Clostridium sp.]